MGSSDCKRNLPKNFAFPPVPIPNATNQIVWQSVVSEAYPVHRGVRQGDPCSGILFEICIDDISDFVPKDRASDVRLADRNVFVLKFADDISGCAESVTQLQKTVDRIVDFSVL